MKINKPAGYCLMGTGLFAVLGFLIHPHDASAHNQLSWLVGHMLIFTALILNLVGLAWMFSSEHAHLGKLGWLGFILAINGLSMYVGKLYWSGLLYPLVLAENPELIDKIGLGPGSSPNYLLVKIAYNTGALLFAFGHLILGAALLRSRSFQALPIWLLMAGAFMVGIWPFMPGIVQMLSVVVSAIYAAGLISFGASLVRMERSNNVDNV